MKKGVKYPTEWGCLSRCVAFAKAAPAPDAEERDKVAMNAALDAAEAAAKSESEATRDIVEALLVPALNLIRQDRRQNIMREYGRGIGLEDVNHVRLTDYFETARDVASLSWAELRF
jgi:hypothetical protein